jgi:cell division protein ZapA (FtsZ GTPase activity inhibitor)
MTEEQKEQLNEIAKQLDGKIEYYLGSTLHTRYKKIVITYDAEQK